MTTPHPKDWPHLRRKPLPRYLFFVPAPPPFETIVGKPRGSEPKIRGDHSKGRPKLASISCNNTSLAEITAKHQSNDGASERGLSMLIYQPFARPANQDKKHFELGASPAKPAAGYFAGVLGIDSEQEILDTIASLSNKAEIEDILFKLFREDRFMARDFMKWRLGMKKNAKRS